VITRRRLLRNGVLLSAGAFLAACGAEAKGGAASTRKVRISGGGTGSVASIYKPLIDADPGLARGIEFEWIAGQPGQEQTQLLSGATDVGSFGALGAAQAQNQGEDPVIVGALFGPTAVVIAQPDTKATTIADLKGATLACQPPTSEIYKQVQLNLHPLGLDLKTDFKVVTGALLANLALFQRGRVDAIVTTEPTGTILVAGGAKQITTLRELWVEGEGAGKPPFFLGPTVRRDWYEQNTKLATDVAGVLADVNAKIRADPQILRRYHEQLGVKSAQAQAVELLVERMAPLYDVTWGADLKGSIDALIKEAVEIGVLERAPAKAVYV
jgi:NitT/TauT family transport system substrate-binding protein